MPKKEIPDSTAVRVALWRALHAELDAKPHVIEDKVGLRLVDPPEGWRERPDMHPQGTAPFRASIVARARYLEDLVEEQMGKGLSQYVILGAGLDTFAQRKPEIASRLSIYEIDQPDTVAWKKKRLEEEGFAIPDYLHLVPVDFETGESWKQKIEKSGFQANQPAVVTSLGVSMYLTREANLSTLKQMTTLAPGSKFVMTYLLPLEHVAPEDRVGFERSIKGAQASGTPFISFFLPEQMQALAKEAGFKNAEVLSTADLAPKYFANRADGLKPSTGEGILVATT